MTPARSPIEFFVPGRANIIGEHTDYNGGLALPIAIQLGIRVHVRERHDELVSMTSERFGRWRSDEAPSDEWSRQALAVMSACGARGLDLFVSSTLPDRAGLSSSAAFIGALALAMGESGTLWEMARFIQNCEAVAGNDVGLLDQLATLGARESHALLIDFARESTRDVALPENLALSAVDTGLRRDLATSAYRERRAQCAAAVDLLGGWVNAHSEHIGQIADPLLRARARHVTSENLRVRDAVTALEGHDVAFLGQLLLASHRSLSDDFDVSTPLIDELVDHIARQRGVFGARLVGGGFGGCVIVAHDPGISVAVGTHAVWPLTAVNGALWRDQRVASS